MRGRFVAAAILSMAAVGAGAQPAALEGVTLQPSSQLGAAALQLNGAGVRTRFFFKVYVAALYVPQRSADGSTLLAQKGPRRISITMLRNVDADTFAQALNEGLSNNHTEAQLAGWQAQVATLNAALKAAGEAKKGDVIHLEFTPETGTRLVVNGQVRGAAMPGDDFFAGMLRIWLGDKPVDDSLKKALLGA